MSERKRATGTAPAGPLVGLRFAIYARKSNEDARHEDHRSTTRQIEKATRYVEGKGGTVLPDQIFKDEDISGAEFKTRAGLLKFLDALQNGRPFDALVTMEDSRLGREQIATAYVKQQILTAGVRIFYYLDDREVRMDSALDKMVSSLDAFASEMEREKTRQRVRDAAERKAQQGYVTGGKTLGYVNVRMKGDRPAAPGEKPDYVVRRIDPAGARVVRGIFRMYAEDHGMVRIAKTLNGHPDFAALTRRYFGRKVPVLRERAGRTKGWSPALIGAILHRTIYHGEITWGRQTHVDRNGRAGVRVWRDEAEWLRHPAPDLRIIPEQLWRTVQDRLAVQAQMYLRDDRGKLWSGPDQGREGRYLLSGLGRCRACGSRVSVVGGSPHRSYGCTAAVVQGACTDGWMKRVTLVDRAFLAAVEREVLTPAVFTEAVAQAVQVTLAQAPNRLPELRQEQAAVQKKIDRLMALVEDGTDTPASVKARITEHERQLTVLQTECARLTAGPAVKPADLAALEAEATGHLKRFATLLTGEPAMARQLLKKLLAEPITFWTGKQGLRFQAMFGYGAVIRELISTKERGPVLRGPPANRSEPDGRHDCRPRTGRRTRGDTSRRPGGLYHRRRSGGAGVGPGASGRTRGPPDGSGRDAAPRQEPREGSAVLRDGLRPPGVLIRRAESRVPADSGWPRAENDGSRRVYPDGGSAARRATPGFRPGGRRPRMADTDPDDIPLLTKDEAIAEVRRWLEVEQVDPEKIFAAFGETTIRYKDLIPHLEQDTPDGKLLLFAISRGHVMKRRRDREMEAMLQIISPPPPPRDAPTS
jgi:DNA invertase Pin-like site-specific DNA recombinase